MAFSTQNLVNTHLNSGSKPLDSEAKVWVSENGYYCPNL